MVSSNTDGVLVLAKSAQPTPQLGQRPREGSREGSELGFELECREYSVIASVVGWCSLPQHGRFYAWFAVNTEVVSDFLQWKTVCEVAQLVL